jgi:trehalose/maltose transport system permease protein
VSAVGVARPVAGRSSSRLLRRGAFAAGIVVGMVIVLFPVYWVVLSAFTPTATLFSRGFDFLPLHWSLSNFRIGFAVVPVWSYLWHSVLLSTVPPCLALLVAMPASYAFGRLKFAGRGSILGLVVFTGFLPIVVSIIPLFELFKALDLIGTWWVMFLVYTGFELGFTTWIMSLFVARIPFELEEAARLDGAHEWGVFRWVIAPLLRPALASLFIVNFLASWNQFLLPTVFSSGNGTAPLVLGISQASENPVLHSVVWGSEAAFGLLVLAPAVIVVLIFQRRISAGLTAGAVKG